MKKALIACTVGCFLRFELNDISILQDMGYTVHVATNFNGYDEMHAKIKEMNVVIHQVDFARSPFSKQTINAYRQLKRIMREKHFDLIHCHTPVASILTRIAAWRYKNQGTKVIYTSHGFHFYQGGSKKDWLLYYPVERLCSRLSDVIITINQEDYCLTRQKFKAKENIHIPGVGIDLDRFKKDKLCKENMKKNMGFLSEDRIILSVGEVNINKNHRLIISSLASMQDEHLHFLIAGCGDQEENNKKLAEKLGVQKQVHFLGYRTDIPELDNMADVFAFPSIREGLGLAAIEALACGTPVIGMDTRGINEYVRDGETGYLFRNNIESCVSAIKKCLVLLDKDEDLSERCIKEAKEYDKEKTIDIMKKLYCRVSTITD